MLGRLTPGVNLDALPEASPTGVEEGASDRTVMAGQDPDNRLAMEDGGAAGAPAQVPCEVYSRIVGYLRPVQAWNKGKQQEFTERVTFDRAIGDGEPRAEASARA